MAQFLEDLAESLFNSVLFRLSFLTYILVCMYPVINGMDFLWFLIALLYYNSDWREAQNKQEYII